MGAGYFGRNDSGPNSYRRCCSQGLCTLSSKMYDIVGKEGNCSGDAYRWNFLSFTRLNLQVRAGTQPGQKVVLKRKGENTKMLAVLMTFML